MVRNYSYLDWSWRSKSRSPLKCAVYNVTVSALSPYLNQRTIGPENAHLKPDLGVLSHNEMTLTLNTHTPLLTS